MDESGTWHSDQDVETIFAAASKLSSPTERAAYLDCVEARDAALRKRVEALLNAQENAGGFMRDATATPVELSSAPLAPEPPGTSIGPYKLLQVIGEGGMGTVYMADQTHPVMRRVALKVVKPGMDSGEIVARFEAERQALALMEHPNIAKVYDAGATENGRPYFAMELVKGAPITEYCDERGLTPRRRLDLFVCVCRAVHHAHQKGVIHRDLKPANVMVADYDDKAVPKVIDFGIAKAFGQKLTEMTMFTQYGQIVGTFEYMSPEQAKFNQLDIDTRSDIYSLGVLLYELLTGTTPFDRERLQAAGFEEVLRIIREEEPPNPSTRISTLGDRTESLSALRGSNSKQLQRALSGELDWIVMRALDKDRARRYESAAAFADDIQRFLTDEAVEACPPSMRYRTKKFVRRHRSVVIAASAVFAVLLLGLVGTILGLVKATAAESRAENERDAQQRLNFRMAVDRGLVLCDSGHIGRGMLWLARALEFCPDDAPAMERVIRANLNAWRRELNTLEAVFPHDAPVITVAVSLDGTRLATGSSDRTAQIWDVRTGASLGEPLRHDADVHELAFSADGARLLAADYLTTAILWDTQSGERIHTFEHAASPRDVVVMATTGGVLGAAFRPPDGRHVVTGCGDGTVAIWDARTGESLGELPSPKQHMVHDVAISPDGRWILTASHNSEARLWDFETRTLLATFRHDTRVPTAAFLDKGGRIATGDADGNVFVWSVEAALADEDRTLEAARQEYVAGPWRHHGTVHRLRVSPDGRRIVSASLDNTAKVWDPSRNALAGPVFEHEAGVQAAVFLPDGERVAVACDDNVARVWRSAAGQAVRRVEHEVFGPEAVYTGDGRYVLVKKKNDDTALVFDTETRKRFCSVEHPGGIRAVAVSPNRSRILTGGANNDSRLFDVATGGLLHSFAHTNGVWSVAFSPDGMRTLAAGFDGVAQLRDARTGQMLREVRVDARVQGCAFSPDNARFILGCGDKLARIYDANSTRPPIVLAGHLSAVNAVSFSRDGSRVVTGSFDNTVRVWNAATGELVGAPMRHQGPVWYATGTAFSRDGSTVVAACDDGTVRVWDVATSRPVGPALHHESGVRMAAFLSDTQVVTGTTKGVVRFWDAERWPIRGNVERVRIWVEVITGSELNEDGSFRALDGRVWQERRARLRALGGAPAVNE